MTALLQMRNYPIHKANHTWKITIAALAFLALALYDAIIGGAISSLLRIEGWFDPDQRVNDIYQLSYGLVIVATFIWLYFYIQSKEIVLATWILFIGYVEDTLFYLLIPLVNPLIMFITRGEKFEPATGVVFPESVSGWLGWLGRLFFEQRLEFDLEIIFGFNAIALAVAALLVSKHVRNPK